MVRRAIVTMVTSATGAILVVLPTVVVPRPSREGAGIAQLRQAVVAIPRPPLPRTVMVVVEGAPHGLPLRSDACATAGPSAADVVLVLVATASLPAALGAPTAMAAGLRRLGARARGAGGPPAGDVGATRLVHAVPTATPRVARAALPPGARRPTRPDAASPRLAGVEARVPRAPAVLHPSEVVPRVPTDAVEVGPRPSAVAGGQGVRLAPVEVVVAGTVAPMPGTARTVRLVVAPATLVAVVPVPVEVVAMAIALQGVRLPDVAPTAVDTRRRGTMVRASPARTGPTIVRAANVGSVVEAPKTDARQVPAPAGGVRQEAVDGRRQDEGMVTALAATLRGAPVALPIRTAVAAVLTTRVGRAAVPAPGREAIGAPEGVAPATGTMVLVVHCGRESRTLWGLSTAPKRKRVSE